MAKTRVKLNIKGFNELRSRGDVEHLVGEVADKVAERAGPGFEVGVHQMGTRVIANVYTSDVESMLGEAKHGALSKAIGGVVAGG